VGRVLVELHVRDLGVFEDVSINFGPGMTALTGETGAGKTLVVEALELLLGRRADPVAVRAGADEALAEARFLRAGPSAGGEEDDAGAGGGGGACGELILARLVPAGGGRSRAWCDGRMAPVAVLSEAGARLVEVHGQHGHQSLFDPAAQQRALDAFAGLDLLPLRRLRAERRRVRADMEALGGDDRARAREIDLLRHQLHEIEAAGLDDLGEDEALAAEEERLADAARYREVAAAAVGELEPEAGSGTGGAVDRLGAAGRALAGRPAFEALAERLRALQAEAADVASELRRCVEEWEDDPERLAEVQARRQVLRDLCRKYGEGLAGVLAYADQARRRLEDLESTEERRAAHVAVLEALDAEIAAEESALGTARRRAAPALARAVGERLHALAMPQARLEVVVGDGAGDDVTFLLGANPGEPPLPLAKVASGGELARAMLALRLVLSEAPPTMVFDEVDAGVGGEAALSVGRALAELAGRHQVLVVTHLAQVAAFAQRQLVVRKEQRGGRTRATVAPVEGEERVVELARMLSGRPGSERARRHAEELLAAGAGALHR
jgi:DNA repair protein RecN (Recombination protein N)